MANRSGGKSNGKGSGGLGLKEYRRESEQKGCRIGVQEGIGTKGIHYRSTGGNQNKRDAGSEGCGTRGTQDRRVAGN